MTEKEKMLSGKVYSAIDDQLLKELNEVKEIIHEYNALKPSQTLRRFQILKDLLGHVADDEIIVNQPFSLVLMSAYIPHATARIPSSVTPAENGQNL